MLRSILLPLLTLTAAGILWNQKSQSRKISQEIDEFMNDVASNLLSRTSRFLLDDLPKPVSRYLILSLGSGYPSARVVGIAQKGKFRLEPGQAWLALDAKEYLRIDSPGYLWLAKIGQGPLFWFNVRDYYWRGRAEVLAKLRGILTIARRSDLDTKRGALIRWATEAVWQPQVFLNRDVFSWKEINSSTATLTVIDEGLSVDFLVYFNSEGLIERMVTNDRPFKRRGGTEYHPFTTEYSDWRKFDGMLLPVAGTATWNLPSGNFTYALIENQSFKFSALKAATARTLQRNQNRA